MIRNVLLAALAGAAWLAAADTAAAQKLEYDCDTQAEHYSVLKAVQDGPTYSAGGTISLRSIFAVKKYVTLGRLVFEPEDKSWRAALGITALMAGRKPVLMATLEITRNGKAEEPQTLGSVLDFEVGKSYPIRLTLGRDGGSATLGDITVPLTLHATGKVEVSVVCSGGEFLFTGLSLGG